jgi:hypothetical protein
MGEDGRAVAFNMFVEPDAGAGLGQDRCERGLANQKRITPQVNHLGVDKAHKLIRKWDATDAALHDSQKLDDLLDLQHRQGRLGGQRLPLGGDRGKPEGEGLAEPYPPARRTALG